MKPKYAAKIMIREVFRYLGVNGFIATAPDRRLFNTKKDAKDAIRIYELTHDYVEHEIVAVDPITGWNVDLV